MTISFKFSLQIVFCISSLIFLAVLYSTPEMLHTQLDVVSQAEALPLANTMEVLSIMSYIFTHVKSTLGVCYSNKVICCAMEGEMKCSLQRKIKQLKVRRLCQGRELLTPMSQTCFQHTANGTGKMQINYVINNHGSFQEGNSPGLQVATKPQGSLNNSHLCFSSNYSFKQQETWQTCLHCRDQK